MFFYMPNICCFFNRMLVARDILLTKIIIGVYKFNWFFKYSSINFEWIEVCNVMTSNLLNYIFVFLFLFFCVNLPMRHTGWKEEEKKKKQNMSNKLYRPMNTYIWYHLCWWMNIMFSAKEKQKNYYHFVRIVLHEFDPLIVTISGTGDRIVLAP